jgi:hypothetical protein
MNVDFYFRCKEKGSKYKRLKIKLKLKQKWLQQLTLASLNYMWLRASQWVVKTPNPKGRLFLKIYLKGI